MLLDIGFDLVEAAIMGRRDRGDRIPYVTAVRIDRIVVDADVAGKTGGHDVAAMRNIDDRLAVGIVSGAIDREADDRKFFLRRRFLKRAAAGAIVLDLVVDI